MRKPAKIGLGIFGSVVAIIVLAGVANAGNTDPAPALAAAPAAPSAAAAPSTTPAPTTTTAAPVAPTADELFVGAVVDTRELVGVGRSICESIGAPGVTHAALVGELGASKWGAAMAEAVVTSAEVNLCPERRYAAPAAPPTQSEPAPSPRPQPRPQPAPRPEPAPAPRKEPALRKDASVYYKNCAAARADGAAPLHVGDPGYRGALDRDKDGVACE